MARILLIKARNRTPDFPGLVPPLGILYLAAALRSWGGHEARVLETGFDSSRPEDPERALREFEPDLVGLSAITMEAPAMHEIAARLKRLTRTPVVAGGPHVASFPAQTLRDPNVDCLVLGEGERTIVDLVAALAGGKDPAGTPGVAVRENGSPRLGPARDLIEDLDSLPFPAWDLLPLTGYFRQMSWATTMGPRRTLPLLTSRGCPYRCIYCHENLGKRFRGRSVSDVLAEVDTLIHRFGVRDFEIVDDIFNWDLPRAKRILDGISRRGPGVSIHFPNGIRCDRIDEEFLALAREAGLKVLCIAVETASPRLQRLVQKNIDLDRLRWTIEAASRMRFVTTGFFMLGFPTETVEEVRATVDFAVHSTLHHAVFLRVTPFGETVLARDWGHLLRDRPAEFGGYDYFRGGANLSTLSSPALDRIQRAAYRRFYLRPARVWRILRDHPRRRFVMRLARPVLQRMFRSGARQNR